MTQVWSHPPSCLCQVGPELIIAEPTDLSSHSDESTSSEEDEYRPSRTSDESTSDEESDHLPPQRTSRAKLVRSTPSTTAKRPSSASNLRATPSFKPVNTLSQARIPGSSGRSATKFGRGYTKRVRDVFSDASSSSSSDDDTDSSSSSDGKVDLQGNKAEKVAVKLGDESEEKPWWNPWGWAWKYGGTEFECSGSTVWFSDGPFKGYIINGPGQGTYRPGHEAPDAATLARAESTAVHKAAVDEQDSDDALRSNENSDASHTDPETPDSFHTAPMTMNSSPPKPLFTSVHEMKASERDERAQRTEQYVLAVASPQRVPNKCPHKNTPSRLRMGANTLGNGATSSGALAESTISTESQSTSVLIARQLTRGSSPPSNQELAELLSSSPTVKAADRRRSSCYINPVIADEAPELSDQPTPKVNSSMSMEAVTDTPTKPSKSEQAGGPSTSPGVASRPRTRSTSGLPRPFLDLEARETDDGDNFRSLPRRPRHQVVVEVPDLTAKQRAAYAVVPSLASPSPPLRSFKDIDEQDQEEPTRQDGDEEALDFVLQESSGWLNNVTEVENHHFPVTDRARARPRESRSQPSLAAVPGSNESHKDVRGGDTKFEDAPIPSSTHSKGQKADSVKPRRLSQVPIPKAPFYVSQVLAKRKHSDTFGDEDDPASLRGHPEPSSDNGATGPTHQGATDAAHSGRKNKKRKHSKTFDDKIGRKSKRVHPEPSGDGNSPGRTYQPTHQDVAKAGQTGRKSKKRKHSDAIGNEDEEEHERTQRVIPGVTKPREFNERSTKKRKTSKVKQGDATEKATKARKGKASRKEQIPEPDVSEAGKQRPDRMSRRQKKEMSNQRWREENEKKKRKGKASRKEQTPEPDVSKARKQGPDRMSRRQKKEMSNQRWREENEKKKRKGKEKKRKDEDKDEDKNQSKDQSKEHKKHKEQKNKKHQELKETSKEAKDKPKKLKLKTKLEAKAKHEGKVKRKGEGEGKRKRKSRHHNTLPDLAIPADSMEAASSSLITPPTTSRHTSPASK
ncbi:hypothetical protein F4780DRAFT_276916 [Xylariomycetidae sp. FL0641]|nr:hypothetical protein F4780DRAFT_276916 [Xylariomycetidae sp. FL0641]